MIYLMILLLAILAIWAIEKHNLYALGGTGLLVSGYLFILGAPLTAALQLIGTAAIVFILQQQLAAKPTVKAGAPEWLAGTVIVLCLVAALLAAASLIATLLFPVKILDLYAGVIILVVGLYGVGLKKDLRQVLIGIIVMQFAAEIILTALGETASYTPLLGLLIIWVMAGIIARLDNLDLTKLQELKG